MNEYLNISQIARELNVSRQAIYSKLKSPEIQSVMCQYTVRHNNRTLYASDFVNVLKQAFESVNTVQTLDTICQEEVSSLLQSQFDLLKATIETLTAQLAEKDKQISEKDKQIAEKDKQISALSEQNANLTTTLNQQQALHAGTIQSMLMQQQKEPASPDIVKPQPTEQASAEPEQQPQKEPAEDPPPQKLSFFQRLFRKRSE